LKADIGMELQPRSSSIAASSSPFKPGYITYDEILLFPRRGGTVFIEILCGITDDVPVSPGS